MPWPVFADELDALARSLQRMSLVRSESAYETRSELAHEMRSLSKRIRDAATPTPGKIGKIGKIGQPITPGTVTDRKGNVIPVAFRGRRRGGRVVPPGYR